MQEGIKVDHLVPVEGEGASLHSRAKFLTWHPKRGRLREKASFFFFVTAMNESQFVGFFSFHPTHTHTHTHTHTI